MLYNKTIKRVEYWAQMGKIAEDNPDLPLSFIKDILQGREEIKQGLASPYIGEQKKGDLKGVGVHKFKVANQLFLVAYEWSPETIYLIAMNAHEDFYGDLKRYIK